MSDMSRQVNKKELAQKSLFACVEGGGQSWLVLVSEGIHPPKEIDSCRFYTTEEIDGKTVARKAEDVINDCVRWLKVFETRHGKLTSIGIVSFGPTDLNPKSRTFGYITTTPKEGWQNTDVVGPFSRAFKGTPVGFDTDVNMVAVSEYTYGDHGDISSAAYITVGTGIGVGVCTNGKSVHGLIHPEGGHIRAPRYQAPADKKKAKYIGSDGRDSYPGNCKFHCLDKDGKPLPYPCVEGMANSDAIADRLQIDKKQLKDVKDDHPIWDLEAYYLAQLCISITFLTSPEVIVIGGGIMNREILFPKIREQFKMLLGGYFKNAQYNKDIDSYITRSKFDAVEGHVHAGVMGGLELARRMWELSDKYILAKQKREIERLQEKLIAKNVTSNSLRERAMHHHDSGSTVAQSSGLGMLALGIGAGCSIGLLLSSFLNRRR